ncbi:MAG TPA: methyltransferase domain-containing protein [Candidatus Limnocylindrales bacterium]|nr:methyltransferase domain-containing protein [Candidatus Limnocylindrales bacterium]
MKPASGVHAQFTASIPEFYDRCLGPVIFEPYARDLARRLPRGAGRVLELACGSGIVTRRLLEALPADASLLATDLNPDMVEHARKAVGKDPRVSWRAADMIATELPGASFDVVVCQFGLMFAPDKEAALSEARRLLAPGGTYLMNVWDAIERNRFAAIANEVITSFFPADPPTFYQVPFSLNDQARLKQMLRAAGFARSQGETVPLSSTAGSAEEFARGLVEGNPVVNEIQARGASVAVIEQKLAERLRAELGDDPVPVKLNAIVFEAG